ncbi:MAG: hypothetical protein L0G27_08440 [Paracoccus sp. (in: a-proteobacteria)]|nr:hypothetical protein [Paracoccus sp. (in: a-proteobacteria)]
MTKGGTVFKQGDLQTVPEKGKTVVKHPNLATALICLALGSPMVAYASSDEAWAELRQTLVETCDELAKKMTPEAQIQIAPNEFGSESYAVALVTSTTDAGQDISVCIYDKQSEAAELTTPFIPTPE